MHAQSFQSCMTLFDPVDCILSGSSSMGFAMQEYWKGLPSPPPRDFPNPRIFLTQGIMFRALEGGGSLPLVPPGKPLDDLLENKIFKVLKGEWKFIGRIRVGVPHKENRIYINAWR